MERNGVLLLGLFLVLVTVDRSLADKKVDVSENTGSDSKINSTGSSNEKIGGSNIDLKSTNVGKVEKDTGVQLGGSKEGIENDTNKSNLNNQTGSKEADNVQKVKGDSSEADNVQKVKGDSNEESNLKVSDEKKGKPNVGLEHKEVTKEKGNGADSTLLPPLRKEGTQHEKCDPSNMCTDKEDKFVACLRVPGNESPHLSLLIQNKGKGPLTVKISASDFVQLENTKVQLQEKEDKKVKVSIRSGGTNNLIVLTAGKGRCSLDFRNLNAHNFEEPNNSMRSTYTNFLSTTPIIAFMFFAVLLILASSWICISFRRRQLSSNDSKYQRLDMELPVLGGAKTEPDINDAWDNSWGDSWDDEEAPNTPSMPITPSLSSKGLASRRLNNKDGWKD